MPGRSFTTQTSYRYGFNGKEKDLETAETTTYDYGFRIYNPGLGRFLSVDPLVKNFCWLSSYQYSGNNPIRFIDLDGGEPKEPPLPGMEGMIVHAPKLIGPEAGEIKVWLAIKGQWVHTYLPATISPNGASQNKEIYNGPSTYYDVAQATSGIPSGQQYGSASLNIEFNGLFNISSLIAQPVFTKSKEISYYVVGNYLPILDEHGKHYFWQNVMIINRDDIAEMTFEKINAFGWGMRASFKSRMMSAKGDMLGAAVQTWVDVNSDPMNWLNAAMIYSCGLSNETPIKGTLNSGEVKVLYRGGQNKDPNLMKLKENEFQIKPNSIKKPISGLSLTTNKFKAEGFGGSHSLTYVPKGLKAIHTPSTFDPQHFDLIPINPKISTEAYQKLLNQVKTKLIQ